jgi:hypothetical protein
MIIIPICFDVGPRYVRRIQQSLTEFTGFIMEIEEEGEIQGTFDYTGRRVDTYVNTGVETRNTC